ncbi:MAG: hypothetical protein Q4E57_10605 [Eubacteriales bacterium]|nr:hypothetical protein [Eubacteriales bacterium]
MRKSFRKAALIAATGAMLAGTAISAQAASLYNGQWCVENNGYWFKLTEDGSVFLANTWYWIKDSDGAIRCYYFDQNGWLATNQTISGNTVNEQGQWVVNGVVQTKTEAETDYATHSDLSTAKPAAAAATTTTTTTTTAAASGAAPATAQASGTAKTSTKKAYKSSGAGDNPANGTFTQAYESSRISGSTVSNNWANFTMTFSVSGVKSDDSGSGTDFYIDNEDAAGLYVSYFPLDKYTAGNTSLDSFVSSYLNDARGYKGGSNAGTTSLGAYTFRQLTKTQATPEGNYTDHCYIRQVDGTNYAMVISVEQNGTSENYLSSLNTMAKLN